MAELKLIARAPIWQAPSPSPWRRYGPWFTNVAQKNYFLQGWKRGRIYPDFIFAGSGGRIVVLETKGDHLQNPDTDYKRDVLRLLTDSFAWDAAMPVGELQLVKTGETVECALILMRDIEAELPALIGLA